MKPGDVYQMTWSDKRLTYLMVSEDIDADLVLMRKWVHSRKAWTKYGMPMQKLTVTSGRKLSAEERAKLA